MTNIIPSTLKNLQIAGQKKRPKTRPNAQKKTTNSEKVRPSKKTAPAPDLKAMARHIRYLHGTGPFTYQVFVKKAAF